MNKLNNILHYLQNIVKTEKGQELSESEKRKVINYLSKKKLKEDEIEKITKMFLFNGQSVKSIDELKDKRLYNRLRVLDFGEKWNYFKTFKKKK